MIHNSDKIERLEELPTHVKSFPHNKWREYRDDEELYKRIDAWIDGCIGMHIDDVTAKWVRLDWVPARIRTHSGLMNEGNLKAVLIGDTICNKWGMPVTQWNCRVVNPITGIITRYKRKRNARKRNARKHKETTCIILSDYHQLTKIAGIWYEIKYSPDIMENIKYSYYYKMKPPARTSILDLHCAPLILLKKQLNKKELKKHNLSNG